MPSGLVVPPTEVRPELVAAVTDIFHVSRDPNVVATNLFFAILMMLILLLTSTLFNATLDENRGLIEASFGRLLARLAVLRGRFDRQLGLPLLPEFAVREIKRFSRLFAVLGLTTIVYGFLSPDFGLDARSLITVLSLFVGLGIITYIAEGGQVAVSGLRHHLNGGVRVYTIAIAIAVACVTLSRVVDFRPGILYGFVASFVLFTPTHLKKRQEAELVIFPAVGLLVLSLLAWLALAPVRSALEGNSNWLLGLLEAILAMIFVVGIEGVFFTMIPLRFMKGAKLLAWNKAAWAILFTVAGFCFWHFLLGQGEAYVGALLQTKVLTTIGIVLFYSGLSVATWLFFQWVNRGERVEMELAEDAVEIESD